MSKISYIVEWTINDGKVEEFKSQTAGFIAAVKENEPDTPGYQLSKIPISRKEKQPCFSM